MYLERILELQQQQAYLGGESFMLHAGFPSFLPDTQSPGENTPVLPIHHPASRCRVRRQRAPRLETIQLS